MAVAHITKDELTELRIRRNALLMLKNQYLLAERGFSAFIGETIRRYRRNDEERLRINLDTGDIEVASPSTVGYDPVQERVETVTKEILDGAPTNTN